MIHIDTIKRYALYVVILFFAWNWGVAEKQVRDLVDVGSSMGAGWNTCMVALQPRIDELEEEAASFMGRRDLVAEVGR